MEWWNGVSYYIFKNSSTNYLQLKFGKSKCHSFHFIGTACCPFTRLQPHTGHKFATGNLKQYISFNWLGPSDAIWRWRSWSTLVQVMACCLTAPSHYLNQCWLIISTVQCHPSESNFTKDTSAISEITLKMTYLKFCSYRPGANELSQIRDN